MFGIDVEKLAIIGTVALIVIGPERLPRVARTLGALLGRAQRYMTDIKAEVAREIQLDELKHMRETVRSAAENVHQSIHGSFEETRRDITGAITEGMGGAAAPAASTPETAETSETPAAPLVAPPVGPVSPAKRNRWRRNIVARQSSLPLWYRHTQRRRTRVLSGAARVARYRTRIDASPAS